MDPSTLGAILAGVGLLKSQTIDKTNENNQRTLRATEQALSPFTGLQAQTQVQPADPFGQTLAFGSTGFSLGEQKQAHDQAVEAAKTQNDILKKLTDARIKQLDAQSLYLDGGGHPSAWDMYRAEQAKKLGSTG